LPSDGDRHTTVFVDPATGAERWRAPHDQAAAVFAYDPKYAGGTLFEADPDTISVAARDPLTGAIRWQLPASLGYPLADSGTLYLAALDGIQAINESDTTTRWTTRVNESVAYRPAGVTRGLLVLASP
jgi:outer membrane protein assembly factor BamB